MSQEKPTYKLEATIRHHPLRKCWMLEISGHVEDTFFTTTHRMPESIAPDDVAGLPLLYEAVELLEELYKKPLDMNLWQRSREVVRAVRGDERGCYE